MHEGNDERFRALIEAAPDPIGVFRAGKRIYANPALARLLGFESPEEMVGLAVHDVVHPDDRPLFDDRNRRRDGGEMLPPCEYRLLRRDGVVLVIEMTSIAATLEDGPAVLVMMRDRTDYRRLEAELRQAERLAGIGALAASVAHEINNPLAYLMMNLEIALSREISRDELRELLNGALEGAERVRMIAADLRTLARTDGRPDAPIEIARAADAAVTITTPQLREVSITRDHECGLRVLASEGRLVQVIANLLVNAVQADARNIRVRTFSEGEAALVEIEDDGLGIPPDVLPRVFERFFSTKRREVGTGLGLPIAKDLIEAMGGTLSIASEGNGATATIRLPRTKSTSRPDPRTTARRARILLVDDEPAIGRALTVALGDAHDVVTVNGGLPALELLSHDDGFDVILCDVTMPDLAGPDLMARVPALATRFVFITGGSPDRSMHDAVRATGRPILQKPFDLSDIQSLVAARMLESA